MANPRHAGRKRKLNAGDEDQAYQRRQTQAFKKLQKGLKPLQPTPPNHLDRHGKWLWRQLAPELTKIGNVKYMDGLNLASLCSSYSDFWTAEHEIAVEGPYSKFLDKDGKWKPDKSKPNPMFAIKNTAERTIKTLSADLGMSFNARAAANIESEHYHDAPKPQNPLKVVNFNP